MKEEMYQLMKQYAAMITSQTGTAGSEAQMFLKDEEGIWVSRRSAEFSALKREDICFVSEKEKEKDSQREKIHLVREILKAFEERKGVVISQTPYCQRCLREKKEVRAVLDDMAQIIGTKAEITVAAPDNVIRALRESDGCFAVRPDGSGYTITTGRNLYEAVVGVLVLEKSAEVYVKAEVLGGAKAIPSGEAEQMRKMYKQRYSKIEQAARTAEEKRSERGKK